jgi:predicted dehydrogenase
MAVIGVGGMGQGHVKNATTIEETQLVGVCDIIEERAKKVSDQYGVPWFTDHRQLLSKVKPQFVMVATPHPQHVQISIDAMRRKVHVLCEKPIAATVSDGDKMIAAAEKYGVRFGVMFQMRTEAIHQKAKAIIEGGQLGQIARTDMIASGFRTQTYYNSDPWRARWSSEGGGVLLNQAPHHLDMFTWLCGQPSRVHGWTKTRIHDIVVEDTAFALVEYANGAQGTFHASTSEAPGTYRVEVCGDKGKLIIEDGRLRLALCETPASEFARTSTEVWASPKADWQDVEIPQKPNGHAVVMADFVHAILENRDPIAPGREGIRSLELANAIILSSKTGKTIDLPLVRPQYDRLLRKLIAETEGQAQPSA